MPKAPNVEKVIYVLLTQNKSPSVQSVFKSNEEKVSQSVVESVPKANVQSVLRPRVKLVPKANVQSVHSSGMNSTVNSAGKESAHNQSASSAPKLVMRKKQGLVQGDSKGVPTAPPGIGYNKKTIPKSQLPNPLTLNPVFRWITALGDEQERGNQTRNTWIFLQSSLALTFGTQSHHTKMTFTQYEH